MDNVAYINQGSAYDDILFWIEGLESDNTRNAYHSALSKFMDKCYGIDLKYAKRSHFTDLSYREMKEYQNKLRQSSSINTVNREMQALYSLFKELNKYGYKIDLDAIRVKPLKVTDSKSYGDVTWDEVSEWIDYVQNSEMRNKESKAAFLELARITALRKQALANLKYEDLRQSGSVWQIRSSLKGKIKDISIPDYLAELLHSLRKDPANAEESILKMSPKTMERLLDDIKEEFNIPKERNITLHSLRGLSLYEAYQVSNNDILAAQEHAGHSDFNTTFKYIQNRKQSENQPSLIMGQDLNQELVNDLSAKEWKDIFSKLSKSAQFEILSKISENPFK